MKICPQCQKITMHTSIIEVKCNGKSIHGVELCSKCRDEFFSHIPLYNPKSEDILPSFPNEKAPVKIVTKEQFLDIMSGKITPDELPHNELKDDMIPCPNCGHTPRDIAKTGQFGCGHCYEHFQDLVGNLVSKVQDDNQHHGKIPKKHNKEEKILELKLKLARAKEHQDFTEAAAIVNQLKSLQ